MADALATQMVLSPSRSVPTVEMNSPGTNDESRTSEKGSLIPRMGTRKHNIAFGK